MPSYPWCEHLQFSYGNMRSCNDGHHLYGGYAQYAYLETNGRGAEIVVECVGRPARKTAVRLKNGGTGIPPVKLDLHQQIRCL